MGEEGAGRSVGAGNCGQDLMYERGIKVKKENNAMSLARDKKKMQLRSHSLTLNYITGYIKMNLKRETNFTGYFHCPLQDFSKALLPPASSLT